jgi:nucleotide-binding universal stress UspA family protein
MYKNILVPVDGSEPSELALREAIRLSKSLGATLHVMHVVDEFFLTPMDTSYLSSVYYSDLTAALRKAGQQILDRADTIARQEGATYKTALVETFGRRVAQIIVEQAKETSADLIVMGTHGRRGLRRLVMGSDAEGVLRTTTVPVLMVRGTESAS